MLNFFYSICKWEATDNHSDTKSKCFGYIIVLWLLQHETVSLACLIWTHYLEKAPASITPSSHVSQALSRTPDFSPLSL